VFILWFLSLQQRPIYPETFTIEMSFIHSPTTLVCCHLPFCNTSFRMDVDLMRLVPKPVLISTSTQVNDCVFLLQAHIRGADHDACFLIFVVLSRCMLPHICGADHDACILIFVVPITIHASSYLWCRSRCMLPHICGAVTMHASSYLWCDHDACFLIFVVRSQCRLPHIHGTDHDACFLIFVVRSQRMLPHHHCVLRAHRKKNVLPSFPDAVLP